MTEQKKKNLNFPVNVFVVGGGKYNANFLHNHNVVETISESDMVIFTGGEDINPNLYNKGKHPTTNFNDNRDRYEVTMFHQAKSLGKYMFGICRGAQLLCALSGGTLVQHQIGSNGSHNMVTSEGEILLTTHIHHQSMNLEDLGKDEYELLAWDETKNKCYGESWGDVIERDKDPEFVYFNKTKAFGYQGHPEMMSSKLYKDTLEYINKIITEKIN